jgi:hypothetical protein
VIDRSKTRDIPLHPSAVKGRSNDWNLCRGNHLGQRSCASATIGRTYGRKRSDQSTAQQLARSGPSTYGSRKARDQMDAAVMSDVRGQRCSTSTSRARLQPRQFPAHVGDARADQGLVDDEPGEKLIKIGAKVGRYVAFQKAEDSENVWPAPSARDFPFAIQPLRRRAPSTYYS